MTRSEGWVFKIIAGSRVRTGNRVPAPPLVVGVALSGPCQVGELTQELLGNYLIV